MILDSAVKPREIAASTDALGYVIIESDGKKQQIKFVFKRISQ
jgi:hypothetical protein